MPLWQHAPCSSVVLFPNLQARTRAFGLHYMQGQDCYMQGQQKSSGHMAPLQPPSQFTSRGVRLRAVRPTPHPPHARPWPVAVAVAPCAVPTRRGPLVVASWVPIGVSAAPGVHGPLLGGRGRGEHRTKLHRTGGGARA